MAININTHSLGSSLTSKAKGPLETNLQRLSSGKRINSAKDDAAGLAIAARFAAQISGHSQAYRNVNDGISLAQTAEGAIGGVSDSIQRIRELSAQSANATLSDTDRASLQKEVSMLQEEISRVTTQTQFNGVSLLDNADTLKFQVGANAGDTVDVSTSNINAKLTADGILSVDISTSAGATAALDVADAALSTVSQSQAEYGALQNRFESASRNIQNVEENLSASRSRIEDADYAIESANLTKNLILQNAANAVHAQSNASKQLVLNLLG